MKCCSLNRICRGIYEFTAQDLNKIKSVINSSMESGGSSEALDGYWERVSHFSLED